MGKSGEGCSLLTKVVVAL